MKAIFEFDEATGTVIDRNGMSFVMIGFQPFDEVLSQKDRSQIVLDLIKQGITPDEIVKLKNQDLL